MKSQERQLNIGILAIAGTAFLWSIAGLFIKVIDWNPFAIAGLRSLIASIVILMYLRRPQFHFSFPQVMAAFANAATMILFVTANKTTTAAHAILLQYLSPVLTALLGAVILKERTHAEHWVAFIFSFIGMIMLFMDGLGGGLLLGNVLAILSGITFSLFYIFMRMQKDGSPLESLLLSHWITFVLCLCISIFLPIPSFTVKSLGAIAVLGVFQIGIPALLFSAGIKRISAVSANLIAIIEPVFNPIWVFVVIGEMPGPFAITGGIIIVAAVTGASIITARRKN